MTKHHWRTLAILVALIAPLLLVGGLFLLEARAPQLVALALPLSEQEVLLKVGPIDRAPLWQVYGVDGRPRRRWGTAPLPHGYRERPDGFLEHPERVAAQEVTLPALHDGQPFEDLSTRTHIELTEPRSLLTRRALEGTEQALERFSFDGKRLWSVPFAELLGPTRLMIQGAEIRSAMKQSNGRLLLVVQGIQPGLKQPVSATLVRLVVLDVTTGRVERRTELAPALLALD